MSRVAVVGGGRSCEHAVSLASAAAVRDALAGRHDVVALTIDLDGRWRHPDHGPLGGTVGESLAAAVAVVSGCDVLVPVVHGPHGEDGTLAALGDLAGVPVVGSGVRAGALAMDKWVTKLVAEAHGLRTAPGRLLSGGPGADGGTWGGPVVVKPVAAGSSHGVTLVHEPDELASALETAYRLDDRVLVEELVVGREVDVAVLQRADGTLLVSPLLEIVVPAGLFDTARKYDGSADFRLPADLPREDHALLCRAALTMWEALGCAGVARFDFFLTEHGPVLNEVNTMPGMTEQSQVPRMFAAVGLPYADLLDELVRGALTVGPR